MAKKRIIKISAMAFAIAILLVFCFPATSTLAYEEAPELYQILPYVPKQQYILTFDIYTGADRTEPIAITIPLSYTDLESFNIPVLTSDGSFTIDVTWYLDPYYEILYDIDLSDIARYYDVYNYTIYSVTPSVYEYPDYLLAVACDAEVVRYDFLYTRFCPRTYEQYNENHTEGVISFEWAKLTDVRTRKTTSEWQTEMFYVPYSSSDTAYLICDSELRIQADTVVSHIQFAVPYIDTDHGTESYYESVFDNNWTDTLNVHNPPVYIEGLPDTTSWFNTLFGNLFSIELFPGVTLGGILFCFIAVPLVVIFLKLFAGG